MKRCEIFLLALGLAAAACVHAEGASNQREKAVQKYANCPWTEAMGKALYECVKKNDGFGTHWCFNETLEANCAKSAADESSPPAPTKAESAPQLPTATIEREKTMLKFRDCKWTDEMGKFTYECVKRNNGFGVHWCHDEAIQTLCPNPDKG
jgi:hypothetical protein